MGLKEHLEVNANRGIGKRQRREKRKSSPQKQQTRGNGEELAV